MTDEEKRILQAVRDLSNQQSKAIKQMVSALNTQAESYKKLEARVTQVEAFILESEFLKKQNDPMSFFDHFTRKKK